MKLALLIVASLALSGVTVLATADSAAACVPPNCPGFGACKIRQDEISLDPESLDVTPVDVVCYY